MHLNLEILQNKWIKNQKQLEKFSSKQKKERKRGFESIERQRQKMCKGEHIKDKLTYLSIQTDKRKFQSLKRGKGLKH